MTTVDSHSLSATVIQYTCKTADIIKIDVRIKGNAWMNWFAPDSEVLIKATQHSTNSTVTDAMVPPDMQKPNPLNFFHFAMLDML